MTPSDHMLANCVRQVQDLGWQMAKRVDGGMQSVQADREWWQSKLDKLAIISGMLDELIRE